MGLHSSAQNNESAFDFWVGEWDCIWTNAKGDTITGSNSITKILAGKVIQENFTDSSRNFFGTSISVYNPQQKTWHQAWADNQGGYYDFIGLFEAGKKMFSTDTSKQIIQRMVFYNIEENGFIWDWEGSKDHGQNYALLWRINYRRKAKP